MFIFKLVRKIGRMLRGGAGRKEIFLGALCGVLIGFNPGASLTLALMLLITLLLNANVGFTLLGVLVGKLLGLILAPLSFHTGYFIIHNLGLEGLFTQLVNAPVTALMDLNVYAMVGSLPFALAIGFAFGKFMAATVSKIREQMVRAGEHDKVGKVTGNRFAKFLMWLVFGKQKISTTDVLAKHSPLLRKSGLILVGGALAIGLVFEFFLLDLCAKKAIETAISQQTGAEVNLGKAHLSLSGGKLELEHLQVADPDHLTHNLIEIDTLAADISVGDLLRRTYTIDLLSGSTLRRNTLRKTPGKLRSKKTKKASAEKPEEAAPGQPLDTYLAQAQSWKKYGNQAYDYLKKRSTNAQAAAQGQKPKPSKEVAVADAKKLGYLKAAADLVADRAAWSIRTIQITDVRLAEDSPAYTFLGLYVSSHPELGSHPTVFSLMTAAEGSPAAKVVLHFENPAAPHELTVNFDNIALGDTVETGDALPLDINDGQLDIRAEGTFTADALDLPFTLTLHPLKAKVEEGKTLMGMDAETATEVFSSIEQLTIDGSLGGSLRAPRVSIDTKKLTANLQSALTAAGKKALSKRAGKEMDKAKSELQKQGNEKLNQFLGGKEGDSTEEKAKGMLKKLF